MSEVTLTSDNFEAEVLKAEGPVLVDFWASWCGPCRALAPVLEEFAAKKAGQIKVGKVNVDEEPALAQQYRVMSIPTLIAFENGEIKNQTLGLQDMDGLEALF